MRTGRKQILKLIFDYDASQTVSLSNGEISQSWLAQTASSSKKCAL